MTARWGPDERGDPVTDFVGLTWDHPRGRDALEAAAATFSAAGPDTLRWEAQPLEGFESAPIDELAARYDLLVLDHPHLGDALAADCIRPLDELFAPDVLAAWSARSVGPSAASYRVAGRDWALPLDAATQVSARRADLVPDAPDDWESALRLAAGGLVAPSLAGPHALLTLCSIAVSLGAPPATGDEVLVERGAALESLAILTELAAHAPTGTADLNPIGLLERMTTGDDLGYLPLVYGYVTYSAPGPRRRATFGAPPAGPAGLGSTIGGTGIAITRRGRPSPALLDHLAWLLDTGTQRGFVPEHAGQPSATDAWRDAAVDAAADGFYSGTLATMRASWVRPRFAGYIPFQAHGSALLRAAVAGERRPADALDDLDAAYRAALAAARERTPA